MKPAKFSGIAEAENKGELYSTFMKTNGHELVADELQDFGGKNLGPSPGDYLCMSLASCKVITLRMYIQRKQWKVDTIHVKVNLVTGNHLASGVNTFYCEITVPGDINADQQKRLEEIAKVCPISRLLGKQNEVITMIRNKENSVISEDPV
ncbi:MAG TPA: OsmC family protein [Chitinophagaceae bacterium]|nr:OsmC family protein [Chitinophagaceae bacterium]